MTRSGTPTSGAPRSTQARTRATAAARGPAGPSGGTAPSRKGPDARLKVADVAGGVGVVEVQRHRHMVGDPLELMQVAHEAEPDQRRRRLELLAREGRLAAVGEPLLAVDEEDRAVDGAQDLAGHRRLPGHREGLGAPLEVTRLPA